MLGEYADAGIQRAIGVFREPEVSRTEVVTFSPVAGEKLANSFTVEKTVSGVCGDQASLVSRSAATRCSHGHQLEDPCWLEPADAPKEKDSFICLLSAWDTKVVRVMVAAFGHEGDEPLELSSAHDELLPQPFGIEVQHPDQPERFLRCRGSSGTKPLIGGGSAYFDCWEGEGGSPVGNANGFESRAGAVQEHDDEPWEVPIVLGDDSAEIQYAKVRKAFL
ncbi:hypothetical protein [Streptomyces pratensis]|uniref:hypothetical protein n=1 Tax=Streptomyces pratensis TaxID=1169025 RepID=UPI003637DFF3